MVTAEQVAEHHAYGHLMTREGNRGPLAAPQGVYACAGQDQWVALAVATDEQWRALVEVIGRPSWALAGSLDTEAGRRAGHDGIDAGLSSWFAGRDRDEAVGLLTAAGVPATAVAEAYGVDDDRQLRARGYFEPVDHPIVGRQAYPAWPFHLAGGPASDFGAPAPLLGQHNEEVLRGLLGLSDEDLDRLRSAEVIGDRPVGA
jgi:crotonobetainyl-CoA:carnitine CoA-transferase CaiB-like acyl-CoA transferase